MKSTTLTLTFAALSVSLIQLVAAQPHRVRHPRLHKKGNVVVTVVNTVYATPTEAPKVVVYVDQNGIPVATVVDHPEVTVPPEPAYTPSSTRSSSTSSSSPPVKPPYVANTAPKGYPVGNPPMPAYAPAPVETPAAPVETPAPGYVPVPVETPAAPVEDEDEKEKAPLPAYSPVPMEKPAAPSSGDKSGFGLVYSPYKADGTCKTQKDVSLDFESISKDYTLIRLYGTDCDQVATVLPVIKERGIKLFAGIFEITDLQSEVNTIAEAADGDWSNFHTISVGNELVNFGKATPEAIVAAIGEARGLLKAAGYTGNVVAVDTLVAARANPSICDASDYCAVNCHPFFDGNVAAEDSGKFLTEQTATLKEKLADKNMKVVVAETGWPWQGLTNGKAVPSLTNQQAAIKSIKTSYSDSPESVILFTAFNDLWKTNDASQYQAEEFWGLDGQFAPSG
ncbi:uncharacterized protein L3040_003669 [Drepanopeziza brunnea f. sp. 'multigermtubi']|uniref:Cell wall glucanase n=1 Tax=Marssonina brunnea f. sp. multigermtubi (strain MB_m1) TaxID=1072389 RepID=K1XP03_MARBU|nr:cell wall glucanase [Drepanopeziza brunnea f. sp. 'multigermtubi' MB_m1]EKD14189.1 cell wall glucanase [Drepanopeziza brunnea f. sp. 'multigermtubi' MB_m1]KAJ5046425.1 hypothetical protein L3040_003669 [Drepanopeziza brunnea f. sp. 'multigermtubi']